MNTLEGSRTRINPVSAEERQLILDELAEVLKTPHFANSKRYPAFLMYTVEKAIEGQATDLKERTLGVEVFHRRPDYDTNSDTVVRFAAGEVRKRLALVYHESDFQHAVQIVLPTGSYVPEFFRVHPSRPAPAAAPSVQVPAPIPIPIPMNGAGDRIVSRDLERLDEALHTTPATKAPSRNSWLLAAAGGALLVAIAGFVFWSLRPRTKERQSSVVRFWQPISAIAAPTLIATGANVFPAANSVSEAGKTDDYPYMSVVEARALVNLVDIFASNHTGYQVKPTSLTTLTDLREHPVVLLGAYNNHWTLQLLNDTRFRFALRPALQIYDETDRSRVWERPADTPYKDADDYAVVARFHDKLTDNMVVVLAGIGKNGTEAAAQFVTTASMLDQLDSESKGWASRNFEVVLKTRVVDGKTGAPSIEALYVW